MQETLTGITRDTRTRILETAAEMFSTLGYHGVSIREICEKVGVGKPTLYYYFKDKETLLEELLRYAFDLASEMAGNFLHDNTGFLDRLKGLIHLRQQFSKQFPHFIRFFVSVNIFSLPPRVTQLVVGHLDWTNKLTSELIEQGKKEGLIPPDMDPRILAYTLLGALNHLTFRHLCQASNELISEKDADDLFNFWQKHLFISDK